MNELTLQQRAMVLLEARAWIAECWDDVDPDMLSDAQVEAGINRHYAGGWAQLVKDLGSILPSVSQRGEITEYPPDREGNGTSRRWSRTIQGRTYSFTAVLMPNGERRYFASRLDGNDARFACSWTPVAGWIVKP